MKGKGRVSVKIFLRCHVHTRISLRHTALLLTPVSVTASSSLVALGTVLVAALGVLSTFTSGHLRLPSPAQRERLGRLTLKKGVSVERQEWKHEWVPAASPDAREEGGVQVWLLKV